MSYNERVFFGIASISICSVLNGLVIGFALQNVFWGV